MEAATLDALKASIAKWEKNARVRKIENALTGSDSCPLCALFVEDDCLGCPVAERSGFAFCRGTPWANAYWAFVSRSPEFRTAARAEVEFLKSLLPDAEGR